VKYFAAPLWVLAAAKVMGAPAYVSDELVLGVYAEQNGQGQRLATLHSGASLETLGVSGEFTQIRMNDGTTGWVKSSYLTTQEPATVRIKQLEEELDQRRATTPALAEAAARNELLQLKRELASKQAVLDAVNRVPEPAPGGVAPGGAAPGGAVPGAAPGVASKVSAAPAGLPASVAALSSVQIWSAGTALLAGLLLGFWLGYAALARRIKNKFGGLKVY
jgi:hypothetical protein